MRMNLGKTALAAALGVVGLIGAGAAQASSVVTTLQTGDVLAFTAGPTTNSTTIPSYGSYFDPMKKKPVIYVGLQPGTDGGIKIGTAQAAGAIDQPWHLNGHSGSDFTVTGPSALGNHGTISGVVSIGNGSLLDMSNWRFTYDGATINLGGVSSRGDTHEATFNWNGTYGDPFTLDYSAHVPYGESFSGQPYKLHMVGAVEPVPLPAAAWLFGSGLLGLLGIARRKKSG